MCATKPVSYKPIAENHKVYKKLYALYRQLHDGFGLQQPANIANVMKDLLNIKDGVK